MFNNSKWIKAVENTEECCYAFRKEFEAEKKIKKATLAITAMGMYCAFINGQRVGDQLFTPYWTEYSKRLQYQTYDVTDMIRKSTVLEVVCAEGWAVGYVRIGTQQRRHYADNIGLLFSLNIVFEDGTEKTVVSDDNVRVRTSHIIKSSIYHGETVDKTAPIRDLGFAVCDDAAKPKLIPQQGEKVTQQDIIYPVKLIKTPKGENVIDFGQNFSGYAEVTVSGKKGDRIVLSHGEILDKDGNFYNANLRTARQKNVYVMSGEGVEVLSPTFTWQGFRYVRIDEFPSEVIDLSAFRGIVVHSDIKRTGDFVCGNPKINQLYHNIIWGQKSNYVDVPTDCPQRDERLGWTGDAHVFVRTAAINFDVERFFEKWLGDLAAGQKESGAVELIVPTCNLGDTENVSAAWGDAAVICPWEIYMAYGNKKILENQFESMKKWVEYIHGAGEEEYLWLGGSWFGDWLALDAEPGSYAGATDFDYISSAYFAHSTELLIKAGTVLGYDMTEYEELYENVVNAFKERFIQDGLPISKTQTAYAVALHFGLCDDRKKTADGLAQMVRDNGSRLTTGFVGTPYLLHALSDNGYADVAFDLLLQEEFPSWLFSVNRGATTIWEHWDGVKADGSFWDDAMNSYNHYAYGSVYDWIFGVAAGIKVLEDGAGYRHIQIKPHADRRLGFLKAGIESRCGKISSHWYFGDNSINFEFEIPAETVAEILLPDGNRKTVTGGKYMFSSEI